MGGEDLFDEEVERRVRSGFECRTEEQVAEYYSAAGRGTKEVPGRWLDFLSPPGLAALDCDVKALLVLQAHDLTLAPLMAAYNGHTACLETLRTCECDHCTSAYATLPSLPRCYLPAVTSLGTIQAAFFLCGT